MIYDFDTPLNRRGTNCMKWDDMGARFGRDNLLPFWVADMDFRSPPEVVEVLRGAVDSGVFGYPVMTDGLRDSVAKWQETRHGWKVDAGCVGFTPGVVTGLACAVNAFTSPGDGIVIQTPVYPPFFDVIAGSGREIVENPLLEGDERYEMDYDGLRELLASRPNVKALILCSPHNPVARVWTREELRSLAGICLEHGVVVFSDEIHQDLAFSDAVHVPLALASPEIVPNLVTLVAPSKTFNLAGLASSAWIAEGDAAEAMNESIGRMHLERLNMLGALAMETAYRKGSAWLDELLTYLEGNRTLVETFLRERLPGAMLKHPEGTYIFWLDFRGYGLSSDGLQRILVEEAGVALNAGTTFGRQGEGFARLNIGCPRAQLEEGLSRIAKAFA